METRRGTANLTKIGALILSPTRELAKQIKTVLDSVLSQLAIESLNLDSSDSKIHSLSTQLFIGGSQVRADLERMQQEGGNIIVGTVGRIEELLTHTRLTPVTYPYLDSFLAKA